LNPVFQVLKPVHELIAGQRVLIINQRQRLRHAPKVKSRPEKSKAFADLSVDTTSAANLFSPPYLWDRRCSAMRPAHERM
jgi:hypothetical protein